MGRALTPPIDCSDEAVRDGYGPDAILPAGEAARYLRIGGNLIATLTRAGLIPAHRLALGGPKFTWRYERAELDAWMRAREVGPALAEPPGDARHGAPRTYLKIEEAARYVRLNRDYLARLTRDGAVPHAAITRPSGGSVVTVYDRDRLADWVRARRVGPATDGAVREPTHLSVQEAARYVGLGYSRFNTLVKAGRIPFAVLDPSARKRIYISADLDAWMESRATIPGTAQYEARLAAEAAFIDQETDLDAEEEEMAALLTGAGAGGVGWV